MTIGVQAEQQYNEGEGCWVNEFVITVVIKHSPAEQGVQGGSALCERLNVLYSAMYCLLHVRRGPGQGPMK